MSFAAAATGVTMNGGVPLINLGLNMIVGLNNNPTLVTQLYNYASIIPMAVLAFAASRMDTKFTTILITLWAGFAMFAGWLVFPNQGTGFGIIVVMAMLSIMTYMAETQHERYGIAGPGNKIVKIFTFLIILQCVVVFVNNAAIFPTGTPNLAPSNPAYSSIDLQGEIGHLNNTGGLIESIVDAATVTGQLAINALMLVLKVIVGVALFSVVLAQVFPWITQAGPIGTSFLVVIQFAIWLMYLLFIFSVFYRPGPDPGW